MNNLLTILKGNMPTSVFIAAMLFALLGWIIYKWVTAKKRDVNSPRTPVKWSWDFWLKDNWDEALIVGIQLYILVRFAPTLLSYFYPEIWTSFQDVDMMFIYFLVGYGMSYIMSKLKKVYRENKPKKE